MGQLGAHAMVRYFCGGAGCEWEVWSSRPVCIGAEVRKDEVWGVSQCLYSEVMWQVACLGWLPRS